ncbi:MAG: YidC/Oxa1 family membrane protein insertase, partial [Planctomycetota bacterium]|nr:YidC/Oxa1 family membrane protein insertase [Planctomycetota bacterium]
TDLSMPDRLFYLGGPDLKNAIGCIPFPLPDFTYLNLLPILFTTLWVVNSFGQKISEDPQQRQMQKMMRFMPIMFAVMLYNYASGLALYMTISALWSTIEMRIIKKKLGGTAPGMGMTM